VSETAQLFEHPAHPYTQQLIRALPVSPRFRMEQRPTIVSTAGLDRNHRIQDAPRSVLAQSLRFFLDAVQSYRRPGCASPFWENSDTASSSFLPGISSSGNRRHHLGLWTPQSAGGDSIPHILPVVSSASPSRKYLPSVRAANNATRADRLYTTRQPSNNTRVPWVESARQLHTAALRVHHQGMGLLGKDRSRG